MEDDLICQEGMPFKHLSPFQKLFQYFSVSNLIGLLLWQMQDYLLGLQRNARVIKWAVIFFLHSVTKRSCAASACMRCTLTARGRKSNGRLPVAWYKHGYFED